MWEIAKEVVELKRISIVDFNGFYYKINMWAVFLFPIIVTIYQYIYISIYLYTYITIYLYTIYLYNNIIQGNNNVQLYLLTHKNLSNIY